MPQRLSTGAASKTPAYVSENESYFNGSNMFQCTQELELLGCPNVYGPGLAGVASGDLFRRLKLDFSACVDVEYLTRDLLPSWQGLRYCRGPIFIAGFSVRVGSRHRHCRRRCPVLRCAL